MTGTAATEAEEFSRIYELEVTQIPTNMPVNRTDNSDVVFRNTDGESSFEIPLNTLLCCLESDLP